MKKLITIMLISILFISCIANVMALEIDYASLTDEELNELISEASSERANRYTVHIPEGVKASPDKYTWYIQDYVGRNAASFGYTSGADRLDDYGKGYIKFVFVAADGMFIDIEDEKMLQQYIVTGQNITLNTEMKYEFLKNSFGEEYSSLIAFQSIDQIDLTVRRIDGVMAGDSIVFELIPITQSPDKYTQYIRNYIGKNAASFGYASDGGRRDDYGKGSIRINFIADDGSYIDPEDIDILKKYVVIAQDIQPNTEMKLTFLKNSKGKEYSSLIDSMSYESITLYVHKLDIAYPEAFSKIEAKDDEIVEETMAITEQTAASSLVDGTVLSYGDVKYRLMSDDTVEICGYTKLQSSITIPSEIDGHIVNRIADGAFEKNTKLKNLLNWADLTYIGSSAFKGCTELSQISIPSSATYIGESAFEDCTSLKT
ncbi:MAG: leucine-rich repeat domain-containing protein, partial [Christensenellaceae bacterium]|nr:leucine-rich repeat domain-containing protein [Christensenellaceae bacterium]